MWRRKRAKLRGWSVCLMQQESVCECACVAAQTHWPFGETGKPEKRFFSAPSFSCEIPQSGWFLRAAVLCKCRQRLNSFLGDSPVRRPGSWRRSLQSDLWRESKCSHLNGSTNNCLRAAWPWCQIHQIIQAQGLFCYRSASNFQEITYFCRSGRA